MSRGKKDRFCRRLSDQKIYIPYGMPLDSLEKVSIELDEFEAIRLCDYDGKSQIEASEQMGLSRGTVQRLLLSGRKKIIDGFFHSKAIIVKNNNENIKFKGENNMTIDLKNTVRIAFPTNDKITVEEHFGHCKFFAIFTVNDKELMDTEYVTAPAHQPGLLPKFLGELNANAIITGGMGQMAINLFKEANIEVILGARGSIETNLNEYLGGDLYSTGSACQHDHND
ncbi:MAG: DUF134 domain-containing protein [Peptostreptococcaceae bacterium]|nr:DUF134 domain-containing protein [Peptostreptococcaceae bacterium]